MSDWSEPSTGWRGVDQIGDPVDDLAVVHELPARSVWGGIDLGPALRGERKETAPDLLTRTDGCGCLYRAKINGLFGPSEGAKSWAALYAKAQVLLAGGVAVYIDYEDNEITAVKRLRVLGVPDDVIAERFVYIPPSGGLDLNAFERFTMPKQPDMVTVDAATAALAAMGLDTNSDSQVTRWFDSFLRPVARMGPAVLLIDHTGKDSGKGQRGSSAKKDAVDGAALLIEPRSLFAPGRRGVSSLIVAKDRPGLVRENSIGGSLFGDFVIDESGGVPVVELVAGMPNAREVMKRRILEALARLEPSQERPASTRDVQQETGVRDATGRIISPHASTRTVQNALNELAAAGDVCRHQVGQAFAWWIP